MGKLKSVSNYEKQPFIVTRYQEQDCIQGWLEVCAQLAQHMAPLPTFTVAFECYPGVLIDELVGVLQKAFPTAVLLRADMAYKDGETLNALFAATLTDDPVFGMMYPWNIEDSFEQSRLQQLQNALVGANGVTIVVGAGASVVAPGADLLLHAGVARW
jgi:hypothetical protein